MVYNKSCFFYGHRFSATRGTGGKDSTVECQPDLDGIIDSHNVSVILGRSGNSFIDQEANIVSLDNKLRPYHFQTHAGKIQYWKHWLV